MRVFSSRLTPSHRRLYRAVTIFFLGVFFAMMWPIYPCFSRIEPRILGVPLSLAYLVILLLAGFCVLLGLYLWQDRKGVLE